MASRHSLERSKAAFILHGITSRAPLPWRTCVCVCLFCESCRIAPLTMIDKTHVVASSLHLCVCFSTDARFRLITSVRDVHGLSWKKKLPENGGGRHRRVSGNYDHSFNDVDSLPLERIVLNVTLLLGPPFRSVTSFKMGSGKAGVREVGTRVKVVYLGVLDETTEEITAVEAVRNVPRQLREDVEDGDEQVGET